MKHILFPLVFVCGLIKTSAQCPTSIAIDPPNLCVTGNITGTLNAPAQGVTWSIYAPHGATWATIPNSDETQALGSIGTHTGLWTVTATISGCSELSQTFYVSAAPSIDYEITPVGPCYSDLMEIEAINLTGPIDSVRWTFFGTTPFMSNSPIDTVVAPTSFSFILYSSGCVSSPFNLVSINPPAASNINANFLPANNTLYCESPANVTLINTSTSNNLNTYPFTTIEWYEIINGVDSLLGTGDNLPVSFPTGSHSIKLIVYDAWGCFDEDIQNIIVSDALSVAINQGEYLTQCAQSTVSLNYTLSGPAGANICWNLMENGPGCEDTFGSATYSFGATDSHVELIATWNSGCTARDTITLHPLPLPNTQFTMNDLYFCELPVQLDMTLVNPQANVTYFFDVTSSSCPDFLSLDTSSVVDLICEGTYVVTLNANDGTCSATQSATVYVDEPFLNLVCPTSVSGNTLTLSLNSLQDGACALNGWDHFDFLINGVLYTTTNTSITIPITACPDVLNISVTGYNLCGCNASDNCTVNVYCPLPQPTIGTADGAVHQSDGSSSGFDPDSCYFSFCPQSLVSFVGPAGMDGYSWTAIGGSPSSGNGPIFNTTLTNPTDICLIVSENMPTGGVQNSTQFCIHVCPSSPVVTFDELLQCDTTLVLFITGNEAPNFDNTTWNVDGATYLGDTITMPILPTQLCTTLNIAGTSSYTSSSGVCNSSASSTQYISVPDPNLVLNNVLFCEDETLNISGLSCRNDYTIVISNTTLGSSNTLSAAFLSGNNWLWSMPGYSNSSGASYNYLLDQPGDYSISVTAAAESGCTASQIFTLQVIDEPDAAFTITQDIDCTGPYICADLISNTVGSVQWTFNLLGTSNDTTTTDLNPCIFFPVNENISISAQAWYSSDMTGCSSNYTLPNFTELTLPTASLANVGNQCVDHPFTINNTSSIPNGWIADSTVYTISNTNGVIFQGSLSGLNDLVFNAQEIGPYTVSINIHVSRIFNNSPISCEFVATRTFNVYQAAANMSILNIEVLQSCDVEVTYLVTNYTGNNTSLTFYAGNNIIETIPDPTIGTPQYIYITDDELVQGLNASMNVNWICDSVFWFNGLTPNYTNLQLSINYPEPHCSPLCATFQIVGDITAADNFTLNILTANAFVLNNFGLGDIFTYCFDEPFESPGYSVNLLWQLGGEDQCGVIVATAIIPVPALNTTVNVATDICVNSTTPVSLIADIPGSTFSLFAVNNPIPIAPTGIGTYELGPFPVDDTVQFKYYTQIGPCMDSGFFNIRVHGLDPEITITAFCENQPIAVNDATQTNDETNLTYSYSLVQEGNVIGTYLNNFVYTPANEGAYQIIQSINLNGLCNIIDTTSLTIFPSPEAIITQSPTCTGASTTYSAETNISDNSPLNLSWQIESDTLVGNSIVVSYNMPGTYTNSLTVQSPHCSTTTNFNAVVFETPSVHITANEDTLCENDALILNAILNPASLNYIFEWYVNQELLGQDNFLAETVLPGQYQYNLIVTTPEGCIGYSDSLDVQVNALPSDQLPSVLTLCPNDTISISTSTTLLSLDFTANPILITQPDTLHFMAMSSDGCTLLEDVAVVSTSLPAQLLSDEFYSGCVSAVITSNTDVQFPDGSTGTSILATSSDTLIVFAIDNTCVIHDTAYVDISTMPTFQLIVNEWVCQDSLASAFVNCTCTSMLWSNGVTSSDNELPGGEHWITMQNGWCDSTHQFSIEEITIAHANILDQNICIDDSLILDLNNNQNNADHSIQFLSPVPIPIIEISEGIFEVGSFPADDTLYLISTTQIESCLEMDTIAIHVHGIFNNIVVNGHCTNQVVEVTQNNSTNDEVIENSSIALLFENTLVQEMSGSFTFMPDEEGIWTIQQTLNTSSSCTFHDTTTITIDPSPEGSVLFVSGCTGTPNSYTLELSNSGYNTTNHYWVFNSDTLLGNPMEWTYDDAGNYQHAVVLLSNNTCSTVIPFQVQIGTTPTIDIQASDSSICETDSIALFAEAIPSNGSTYQWYEDNTIIGTTETMTMTPTAGQHLYAIAAESTEGCKSATDSITILVHPLPEDVLEDTYILCPNEYLLFPFSEYFTPLDVTDPSNPIVVSGSDTLLFLSTTSEGCTAIEQVIINPSSLPIDIFPLDEYAGCGHVTVDATTDILWNDGSYADTYTFDSSTIVTTTLSDGTCEISDTTLITVTPTFNAVLIVDSLVCPDELAEAQITCNCNEVLWDNGSTSPSTLLESGPHWVEIRTPMCDSIIEFAIAEQDMSAVYLPDFLICPGQTIEVQSPVNTIWHNGEFDTSITLSEPGNYPYQLENEGCFLSETFSVSMINTSTLTTPIDTLWHCVNDSFQVGYEAFWPELNFIGTSVQFESSGLYHIFVEEPCPVLDSIFVHISRPITFQIPEQSEPCEDFMIIDPSIWENTTVEWRFNGRFESTDPNYVPEEIGNYTLTARNACDTVSYAIHWNDDLGSFFAPNSFTPNGDHINDVWIMQCLKCTSIELTIFNRWGDPIVSTNDTQFVWIGAPYDSDHYAQNEVYNYIARVTYCNDEVKIIEGHISIIR